MRLIARTADVITGGESLEDLHTLSNFPVFMGSVEHDPGVDMVADMTWAISRSSGVIQLKNVLPLDILYQAQTTTAAVGPTWIKHHQAFAAFIRCYLPKSILELGGAHGILSVEYQQADAIPWTILEPNPAPVEQCRARFIKGFFDEHFRFDEPFDALVHSHVFEHLYEPGLFVAQLARFMRPGQRMIFSVPDLKVWLERKFTNCLNFEHTVFLTEPYIDYLLSTNGFRVIEKRHVMDGHSIFYATVRDDDVPQHILDSGLYAANRDLYEKFIDYHEVQVREINAKVRASEGEVFLFGAHVFSQYLIAFGLETTRIRCILDNDRRKQGKRLYGTRLLVRSPETLAGKKRVAVILKAGIYNEEIKRDIRSTINDSVLFYE